MQELPSVTRMVRKSSYGRTDLFLDDPGVTIREIRCMGGVRRKEASTVYHKLEAAYRVPGTCCWHCCETITDLSTVVPVPCVYDSGAGTYHVYGCTCSPGCAKAYILEHTSFDRGQHLNLLTRMLRDVYGIEAAVVETPPRPALVRFGGVFDPRKLPRASCRLVHPPFVSYCMIIEEHHEDVDRVCALPASVDSIMEEGDLIDEPNPPAVFEELVGQRGRAPVAASESRQLGKRRVRSTRDEEDGGKTPQGGPMSRFFRA